MFSFLARNWFPLALIGLFLAVVPGIVLVILAALSLDAPVNEWLLDRFQITYRLAMSPWLVLIMLLVPPAIVLLYFLKLKRKPLQVSSTFLWRKSIEDLHVNSLLQWLRQNALLVLQLLLVLFLIYSTLGLRYHGASTEGKHYVIVIDNSASMSARDVKPSRLDWAKTEALKVIDAAGDNDYGMVIAFNSRATTLQAYTNNRLKLREAVAGIEPTARLTRFEEVLTLIDGLANPARSTEDAAVRAENVPADQDRSSGPPAGIDTTAHLFSDGGFPRVSEAFLASLNARAAGYTSPLGRIRLVYHVTGKDTPGNANNLAVVDLQAGSVPGTEKESDRTRRLQAYVRVRNYRAEPAQVTLTLSRLVDGVLDHSKSELLKLEGRQFKKGDPARKIDDEDLPGEVRAVIPLPPHDVRSNVVLHARLEGADDDFALDDEAWFVADTPRRAKVMLVGPPNKVLESYFAAAQKKKQVSLVRLTAADLETDTYLKPARSGNVDLVIFDRCGPKDEKDMPQANTFFIDRPPPPWQRGKTLRKSTREEGRILLLPTRLGDRFLERITSLWEVDVAEAFCFDLKTNLGEGVKNLPEDDPRQRVLPRRIQTILEADKRVPLLFTLPRGPFTDLVMTFALYDDQGALNTTWPHKPSFALFLYNVVNNLGNVESAGHMAHAGEVMLLRPEPEVRTLTITSPRALKTTLERGHRPDFVFGDTEQPGIYEVVGDDGSRSYLAVNLLDAGESAVDPRSDLGIGKENVEVRQGETNQPLELWKAILFVALILLVAEWFFFNKRVSL